MDNSGFWFLVSGFVLPAFSPAQEHAAKCKLLVYVNGLLVKYGRKDNFAIKYTCTVISQRNL